MKGKEICPTFILLLMTSALRVSTLSSVVIKEIMKMHLFDIKTPSSSVYFVIKEIMKMHLF